MATLNEIAREFAGRIRMATQSSLLLEKKASVDQELSDAVANVLVDVDGLVSNQGIRRPLSDSEREQLFGLIDRELGARRGTFASIKEGSILGQLQYQQAVMMMLKQVK